MYKVVNDKKKNQLTIWKVTETIHSYSDELSWLHTSTKPEAEVQEKQ